MTMNNDLEKLEQFWTEEEINTYTERMSEHYDKEGNDILKEEFKRYKNDEESFKYHLTKQRQNWKSFATKKNANISKINEFEKYLVDKYRDKTFVNVRGIMFSGLNTHMLDNGEAFFKFFYIDKSEKTYHSNLIKIEDIINCKNFDDIKIKLVNASIIEKKKKKVKRKRKSLYSI